jgi:hypothetical protein
MKEFKATKPLKANRKLSVFKVKNIWRNIVAINSLKKDRKLPILNWIKHLIIKNFVNNQF